MTLLGTHSLSKSYGSRTLFEDISFTLEEGDRIGLIGPNGAGKSTLLKILVGLENQDKGRISKRQGLRIGYASQVPEFPSDTIENVLMQTCPDEEDSFRFLTRARTLLGKAQFSDFSQNANNLSGGWKKRLDIVRALMNEPDLLLLDEPTNHLDIEGIVWLEKFLLREKIAYVIVSHDRYFLQNLSNKVIELNPCYPRGIFVSEGPMSAFVEHKQAFLDGQAQQEKDIKAVLRDEIEWLRRSPKARTTKSQSRVQRAHELMETYSEVKQRNQTSRVSLEFSASDRETRRLLVAKNLAKSFGEKTLFQNLDLVLSPGTRLGIVGKNGTGKTTLLKLLAQKVAVDKGTVKYAQDLKLVYFDQHREQIPPKATLKEALSPNSDMVNYRGQSIHVNGWAKKFLFSPDRLGMPVECLSGGERARILIAKLMLEPADILFLDEPTNDLDIPTLEVMEESLKEFNGAVVLISHDRFLMDSVCTQILGLGTNPQFFADYSQWEKYCASFTEKKESVSKTAPTVKPVRTKKLSFNEQRELQGMEGNILKIESEIENFQKLLEQTSDAQQTLVLYQLLGDSQKKLDALFARWHELSEK